MPVQIITYACNRYYYFLFGMTSHLTPKIHLSFPLRGFGIRLRKWLPGEASTNNPTHQLRRKLEVVIRLSVFKHTILEDFFSMVR